MPTRETARAGAPCWADLPTSDTERSRAFYGQLFGWTAEEPAEEFQRLRKPPQPPKLPTTAWINPPDQLQEQPPSKRGPQTTRDQGV